MGKRAAGILMPISSLPSDYGIGCFSKSAYEFVDWLKEAGQTYWQILPLGPTSYGDSPYQSFSTFAGNPYFIDLDTLVEEGVLDKKDCEKVNWGKKPEEVDYINVHGTSTPVGDISEVKAIKSVFGDHAYELNISSTKSMTGHLLGAAGAIEAMICVKTVENDIVPPTINFTEGDEDPEIDYKLNFTFNKPQKRTVIMQASS